MRIEGTKCMETAVHYRLVPIPNIYFDAQSASRAPTYKHAHLDTNLQVRSCFTDLYDLALLVTDPHDDLDVFLRCLVVFVEVSSL